MTLGTRTGRELPNRKRIEERQETETAMRAKILGLLVVGLLAGPAGNAVPVKFTFTDTVTPDEVIGLQGVASGDTLVVEVIADNGGADLLAGSWFEADIVSAVAHVGSYVATYGPPYFGNSPAFSTSADGALSAFWLDTTLNNSDNAGGIRVPGFYKNGLLASTAGVLYFDGGACELDGGDCGGRWTYARVSGVPEPGTLALLGIGIAGLGVSRQRRTN